MQREEETYEMASKLLWKHATCMKRRGQNTHLFRTLTGSTENNKHNSDSFRAKPTHKAVGTFGSLTTVINADRVFKVEEPLSKSCSEAEPLIQGVQEVQEVQEPLVVILGWAGATHKVTFEEMFSV